MEKPSDSLKTWLLIQKANGEKKVLRNDDPFFELCAVSAVKRAKLNNNDTFDIEFDDRNETYQILFKSMDQQECEEKFREGVEDEPIKSKEVNQLIKQVKDEMLAGFNAQNIKNEARVDQLERELKQIKNDNSQLLTFVNEIKTELQKKGEPSSSRVKTLDETQEKENGKIKLEQTSGTLNKTIQNLEKNVHDLQKNTHSQCNDRISRLEQENKALGQKLEELEKRYKTTNTSALDQINQLKTTINGHQKQLTEQDNRSKRRYGDQQNDLDSLKKNFENLQKLYNEKMAGQNTSTQQTLNGQKFKELEEFVKSFQTEINTIETKLNGCKEGQKDVQVKCDDRVGKLTKFVKYLQKQVDDFTKKEPQTSSVLDRSRGDSVATNSSARGDGGHGSGASTSSQTISTVTLDNDKAFEMFRDDCYKRNIVLLNILPSGFVKRSCHAGIRGESIQNSLEACLERENHNVNDLVMVGSCLEIQAEGGKIKCFKINPHNTSNQGRSTSFAMFAPKGTIVNRDNRYYFKDNYQRERLIDIVGGRDSELAKLFAYDLY